MLLGLGIVLGFASIGILCWLLFLCAVYAAPLFVAAMVCTLLYDHGVLSGAHAILAGIAAGIMVLACGQTILASSRDLALRTLVSLLLAQPAALAGFGITLGFSDMGEMGTIPAYLFATFGALCVGTALCYPARVSCPVAESQFRLGPEGQRGAVRPRCAAAGRPGFRVEQRFSFCERSPVQTRPK